MPVLLSRNSSGNSSSGRPNQVAESVLDLSHLLLPPSMAQENNNNNNNSNEGNNENAVNSQLNTLDNVGANVLEGPMAEAAQFRNTRISNPPTDASSSSASSSDEEEQNPLVLAGEFRAWKLLNKSRSLGSPLASALCGFFCEFGLAGMKPDYLKAEQYVYSFPCPIKPPPYFPSSQ
jgi:hypothetical protein